MSYTFKGGLHIPDFKELTNKQAIREAEGAPIHIYPLQQHIGAPLSPTVAVGDTVKVGQIIADSEAFVATPVHSSVSGKVTAIKPHLHPSGATVTAIFVENDFAYEMHDEIKPLDPDSMSYDELLTAVRNSGIVGMGGAGFPTHVKLRPGPEKKITHVIVNGAECEPYITADHRRMLENPDDIIDGLHIVMKILGLDRGYIGIEQNKPDAIKLMQEKAALSGDIEVCPLKTKYPQGAEKQLIYAVTKRQVPSGGLPADAGAIVINIDTAAQLSHTFRTGIPLVERIVTISGDCVTTPCNLRVRTGVSFEHLFNQAGGFLTEPKKVIMGGPMMGIAQFSLEPPVVKTTSSLLALAKIDTVHDEASVCLRCGKCVPNCPMRLMPLYIADSAKRGDLEACEKYNVLDCIECGLCSYQCPGRQSPLHSIRIAKQQILENRRKQK